MVSGDKDHVHANGMLKRRVHQAGNATAMQLRLRDQLFDDKASLVTWYEDDFRRAFQTGTLIEWDILFSNQIGGNFDPNSDDWLSITAWNRAAYGCEASVLYSHDSAPAFIVTDNFDGTGPPAKPLTDPDLAQYVTDVNVGGYNLKSITILNKTYLVDIVNLRWRNEVWVSGNVATPPSLFYFSRNNYKATLATQAKMFEYDGGYGPTVEVSRASFRGTNPVGWANARLAASDAPNKWGALALLIPGQSHVDEGLGGFSRKYEIPNSTAVVTS